MDNTSGRGDASVVPPEISGWNWGAFLLNWVWGIGNGTLVALLMFVPLVNLVMPFVLGAKGSEWAWRNREWKSIEAFKATQRVWAQVGVVVLVVGLVVGAVAAVGIVALMSSMKRGEAYQAAVTLLQADPQATRLLGTPIDTGFPLGSIEISGPTGSASLSFSATGPMGEGTVYVEASKALGRWTIDDAVLEDDATGQRIDLTD